MSRRNLVSAVLLLVLLGVFGRLAYSRAYRVFFTVKPAPLAAPYTTEEAWVVDEIVRDITEMSVGQAGAAADVRAAAQPFTYAVSIAAPAPASATVDLSTELWSPQAFAAVARAALGPARAASAPGSGASVHETLLDLTATTVMAASDVVSKALQSDMRNAATHESAALVLAAFALREPVARHADTRWAMNRMTAHLAMAGALRGDNQASVDGQLATAVLLALTNQQVRAMQVADALDAGTAGAAVHAWTRALRLRITEDWRLLADPRAATRLEQREYFRARRATLRNMPGTADLERLGRTMDIDWIRLIFGQPGGVGDTSLVTEALDMERAELDDIYMRLHGAPLVQDETAALNALATRCMHEATPQVVPWGAWAEFGQRRLALVISGYDSYLRHGQGAGNAADTAKATLHDELGDLWTFPSSTIWWTKGPRGKEGDDTYFNEAVATAVANPQRVTARVWTFLEFASPYVQHARQAMAPAPAWFFTTAPRTAYEAALRVEAGGLQPVQDYERLMAAAPYDFALASQYLAAKYGTRTPLDEVLRRAGERIHYDVHAVATAMGAAGEGEGSVELLESACGFSPTYCAQLGTRLARLGRNAAAAAAFERALGDEAADDVAKSGWSAWLVDHYHATGRIAPALALAEQGLHTGSGAGLITAGRLYERLGRMDDAEAAFRNNAETYDAPGELIAFYHRAVHARKDTAYDAALQRELERVFPDGLRKGVCDGPPALGVYIEKDSPLSRAAGLQAGDVIVAVDGWRVDNMGQYRTARALPLTGGFTMTVARGPARSTVTIADRTLVPEFTIANYPVQGWIEK